MPSETSARRLPSRPRRDGTLHIADQQVVVRERALDAVERGQSSRRPPPDAPRCPALRAVRGRTRAAVDRARASRSSSRRRPRRSDACPPRSAAPVRGAASRACPTSRRIRARYDGQRSGSAISIVAVALGRLGVLGHIGRRKRERDTGRGRDLTRNADHRQEVGAVGSRPRCRARRRRARGTS